MLFQTHLRAAGAKLVWLSRRLAGCCFHVLTFEGRNDRRARCRVDVSSLSAAGQLIFNLVWSLGGDVPVPVLVFVLVPVGSTVGGWFQSALRLSEGVASAGAVLAAGGVSVRSKRARRGQKPGRPLPIGPALLAPHLEGSGMVDQAVGTDRRRAQQTGTRAAPATPRFCPGPAGLSHLISTCAIIQSSEREHVSYTGIFWEDAVVPSLSARGPPGRTRAAFLLTPHVSQCLYKPRPGSADLLTRADLGKSLSAQL